MGRPIMVFRDKSIHSLPTRNFERLKTSISMSTQFFFQFTTSKQHDLVLECLNKHFTTLIRDKT